MSSHSMQALAVEVSLEPVPADQIIEGNPRTGLVEGEKTTHYEWGVWEMTPGSMWDIEVDETFVVIAGRGEISRIVDGVEHSTTLVPGVVMTLTKGEKTTWVVEQTLRKVWFCPTTP